MTNYLCVAENEQEEAIEIPIEDDGTLLLSNLNAQFPGACGLKYRNPSTGILRGVRISDGSFHLPEGALSSLLYIVVYPKETNKRKGEFDESYEDSQAKIQKIAKSKCSDLIVLGLPFKSTEDDLKEYFSKFGELSMVQLKRDFKSGQSRGYGFIRFAEYESQKLCISQRHNIDGRWCNVKIPDSKMDGDSMSSKKLYVGNCTEDMTVEDIRDVFTSYGEVEDVFIPKPFKAFAFVTFADPGLAQSLYGEELAVKGKTVRCSSATPKEKTSNDRKMFDWTQMGFNYQWNY